METKHRREGSESEEHDPVKTGYSVPGDGPKTAAEKPPGLTEGSESEEHDPVKTGYSVPGDDPKPAAGQPVGLTEGSESEEHDPVKTDGYRVQGD